VVPPRVMAAAMGCVWNRWATARRMQRRGSACLLGCEVWEDSVEHSLLLLEKKKNGLSAPPWFCAWHWISPVVPPCAVLLGVFRSFSSVFAALRNVFKRWGPPLAMAVPFRFFNSFGKVSVP
jgi:hypothetical protein